MNSSDEIYTILKSGSSMQRLEFYDSLPVAPSKALFRNYVNENPISEKFHISFGNLCSIYCEGDNAALGKDLSHALYRLSLDHHRDTGRYSGRAVNYAHYHTKALNNLGEYEEVVRFVDECLTTIDTIYPGLFPGSWYTQELVSTPIRNMHNESPVSKESEDTQSGDEDFEQVNRLILKLQKGVSLVDLGRIDEAEKVLNDNQIQESTDSLIVTLRNSLNYSISKYKTPGIQFTDTLDQHDKTEERREELLENSIDLLKDKTKNLFTPEQTDEISNGLDNALKNNPRLDFSDPEQREEYMKLREIADRKLSGKSEESDKKYMDDLIKKYTDPDKKETKRVLCSKCDGKGKIICPRCNGLGIRTIHYTSQELSGYIAAGIGPITSEPCSACSGTGGPQCPHCKGIGYVNVEKEK